MSLGSRTAQSEGRPSSLVIRAPRVLARVSDQHRDTHRAERRVSAWRRCSAGSTGRRSITTSRWWTPRGKLVAKRRIADSAAGFAELTAMLAEAGDSEEAPIPVAIETSRGLLVAALRATGRPVYPINPMAVARYRERHSVSRKKSDHVDAMTLANILRTDAHMHRPLPADTELARAIAVLARAHQDATWRRTRAGNELRSLLREYHPGFLAAFAGGSATNLATSRRPCRVGDRADPGRRRQADQGPDRCRAAARRPQARCGQARRTAPPGPSSSAAASGPDGGRGDGSAGPAAAGHLEHRVRQRRPARPRRRRGVRHSPRPPDHHQLHRAG